MQWLCKISKRWGSDHVCRRECVIGEPCDDRAACRASARKVAAAVAEWRARKAKARQEAGLEWRRSAERMRA